jgi:hypothetical protein
MRPRASPGAAETEMSTLLFSAIVAVSLSLPTHH